MQRIARDLPVLLALSASSPFWNEQDTGYASIRSIIWQRWPSAGATGRLRSAAEYDELLADLINTGVIADAKMAYFDVRPSAHAPTLELRTCDACPIVDDAVLIAGLFRAIGAAPPSATSPGGRPFDPVPPPVHRAAIWQAARGGLSGALLDDTRHPKPLPGRAGRPGAGQAAPAPAGGARRLGRGQRAGQDDAGARQLGRPAAGRVRRTRPAQRRRRTGGRRDPRSGRRHRGGHRRCPRCGATGSGPGTRRSARAVGPGRSTAT